MKLSIKISEDYLKLEINFVSPLYQNKKFKSYSPKIFPNSFNPKFFSKRILEAKV